MDPIHKVAAPVTVPAVRTGFTVIFAEAVWVPHGVVDVYVIVALPGAIPLTTPVVGFTEATAGLLLLHAPPARPLLEKVATEPAQTEEAPVTVPAFGRGFTVINCEALLVPQLLENVYLMVANPASTPVTTPVFGSTVALSGESLLHVPPLNPSLV